jgi:hypothetical protein
MVENSISGYEGFEDPENEYYDPSLALPIVFTHSYQVRQFGVGGAACKGPSPTVLRALANPPAPMVTAASKVLTTNIYTNNDLGRYFPSAEYIVQTSGSSSQSNPDGGTP